MQSALYIGDVVHTRIRPIRHKLRYRVFSLLLDVAALESLDKRLRFFSKDRFNLVSLYEGDHGDGAGLSSYLDGLAEQAGKGSEITRFMMLCYPRVLGYAFNPLTVYFGLDADDHVRLMIYEVNNTFGERKTYVIDTQSDGGMIVQGCAKEMYVSPFNDVSGRYLFHVTPPGEAMTIGVALKDDSGPVLKAHFAGDRRPLTDRSLLQALGATGWMTIKVMAGIHWEACKLYLKGLRIKPRPSPHEKPVSVIPAAERQIAP